MSDEPSKDGPHTEINWLPDDPTEFISRFGWKLVEYDPFGKGAVALGRQPEGVTAADLADDGPLNQAGIARFEATALDA